MSTNEKHERAVELLPCPFCGSKAHLFKCGFGYWGTCTNKECECETPGRNDASEAAAIWNRRATPRAPLPIAGKGDDARIPAPRGGIEPNWWEEWVKTTRAYNKLAKAAQAVIDETDRIHDSESAPVKYRAPYGSITKLREVLASADRASLVSAPPSTPSKESGE